MSATQTEERKAARLSMGDVQAQIDAALARLDAAQEARWTQMAQIAAMLVTADRPA